MTQCPSCGTMAPDGMQFCSGCGKALPTYAQPPAETIPYTPYSNSSSATTEVYSPTPTGPIYPAAQGRNIYRLISIVLGVLLIGVSVILILVLNRISGKSAIRAGMGPGDTIRTTYQTSKDLYNKMAAKQLSEGDLLTAYGTIQDVLPMEKVIDHFKQQVERDGGLPSVEVINEEINGDRATVLVRIRSTRPGMPEREDAFPVQMVRENGKWKFDVARF